jgi:hypothetical protein
MMAPKLFGQFLRFPVSSETNPDADLYPELGARGGNNYQLRLGMSWSAIDAYKGLRLGSASEPDCKAHAVKQDAQRALELAPDSVLLRAARAEYAKLRDGGEQTREVLERSRARYDQKLITLEELQAVESRAAAIEHRRNELSARIKQWEQRGVEELPAGGLKALEAAYVSAEMEREQALSSIKTLSAWDLSVTGGALLPVGRSELDWFGWVELRYSLGGLFSGMYEGTYLRARESELRRASYELPQRSELLVRQLSVERELVQQQLTLADKHSIVLASTLSALEATPSEVTGHARDSLLLDSLTAQGELVQLRTRLEALNSLLPQQASL